MEVQAVALDLGLGLGVGLGLEGAEEVDRLAVVDVGEHTHLVRVMGEGLG